MALGVAVTDNHVHVGTDTLSTQSSLGEAGSHREEVNHAVILGAQYSGHLAVGHVHAVDGSVGHLAVGQLVNQLVNLNGGHAGNTLNDKNFPTVNPESPYTLTPEEQTVIDQLAESFIRSERLQRHIEFFYKVGSMYLVCNKNLLCHASVPLTKDGDFKEVIVPQILADGTVGVEKFYGKSLYDKIDEIVRVAHIKPHSLESSAKVELIRSAVDYMWYLWCGPDSPLFDKSAMKTFERYFMDDKESHHEEKGYYFKLRTSEEICDKILKEFSLEGPDAHIINGHVPVKAKEGEFPLKAGGKLMVIDGGFSRAYQKSTGIAGYTLIYNSQGLHIVKHNPFTSTLSAIENKDDIESVTVVREPLSHRILVRETDNGKLLQSQVEDLKELLKAYRLGIIKEK